MPLDNEDDGYVRKTASGLVNKTIMSIRKHDRGYLVIMLDNGTGLTVDPDNLFDEAGMRLEIDIY